jgi:hypothetical protein
MRYSPPVLIINSGSEKKPCSDIGAKFHCYVRRIQFTDLISKAIDFIASLFQRLL